MKTRKFTFCLFFMSIISKISIFPQRSKDLVVENEKLLHKIEQFYDISKVDLDKHLFLKENAEIVLSENEALKEKIHNLRDQSAIIQQELNKKIRECKREVTNARSQVDEIEQVYKNDVTHLGGGGICQKMKLLHKPI